MSELTPTYLIRNDSHEWYERTDCIYGHGLNFTTFNKDRPDLSDANPCGMIINIGSMSIIDHTRVKYISFKTEF